MSESAAGRRINQDSGEKRTNPKLGCASCGLRADRLISFSGPRRRIPAPSSVWYEAAALRPPDLISPFAFGRTVPPAKFAPPAKESARRSGREFRFLSRCDFAKVWSVYEPLWPKVCAPIHHHRGARRFGHSSVSLRHTQLLLLPLCPTKNTPACSSSKGHTRSYLIYLSCL